MGATAMSYALRQRHGGVGSPPKLAGRTCGVRRSSFATRRLGRRACIAISPPTGLSIRSPQDLYAHLGVELAALEREELRILLLNTKNSCFAS
jgi:hypothetical protein